MTRSSLSTTTPAVAPSRPIQPQQRMRPPTPQWCMPVSGDGGRDKYDCHRSSARKRIRINRRRRKKKDGGRLLRLQGNDHGREESTSADVLILVFPLRNIHIQLQDKFAPWGTQYTIALLDQVRTTDWGSSDLYTHPNVSKQHREYTTMLTLTLPQLVVLC
ncbi:hypothetical protein BgiBS90_031028 [Biomphalaria glabrata]|nr:hypothetical protein BgiBS90_031028 [Biomphalaria glabrata]